MTASFRIGDNQDQKIQSKRKAFAHVEFGSENFSSAQIKLLNNSREALAIYMAFYEFAQILLKSTESTIVFTDNR